MRVQQGREQTVELVRTGAVEVGEGVLNRPHHQLIAPLRKGAGIRDRVFPIRPQQAQAFRQFLL
jgi:hypothetical protein